MKMMALLVLCFFTASPLLQARERAIVSPVTVFDYIEWNDYQMRASKDDGIKALKEFSHLVYDRLIRRGWDEETYWKKMGKAWKNLRSYVCETPAEYSHFCSLPKTVEDSEGLWTVLDSLKKERVLNDFQAYWANRENFPLRVLRVFYPNGSRQQQDFSFVAYPLKEELKEKVDPTYWDMQAKEKIEILSGQYFVLHDIDTYRTRFSQQHFAGHWAHTATGKILLNLDNIQKNSAKFAKRWKFVAEMYEGDDDYLSPTLANSDEFQLLHLKRKSLEEFKQTHLQMKEILENFPSDHKLAQKTLKRFEEERNKGNSPLEVYQKRAYETFLKAMELQATFFSLAKEHRQGVDFKQVALESLLLMQKRLDPSFFFHLVQAESIFPQGFILSNIIRPKFALSYFYEHLRLILERKGYEDEASFSDFFHTLHLKGIFKREYLREHDPELLERLKDPQTGEIRDIRDFSLAQQKEIYTQFLFENDGKVTTTALFRLVTSLGTLIDNPEAREMADIIHTQQYL